MKAKGLLTVVAVFTAVALSAGCAGAKASVPWGDYSPIVKTTIDGLASARDCAGLQAQFNTTEANNAITMARTGHNNARLMSYINDKIEEIGC